MIGFLLRAIIAAAGLWLASRIIDGISVDSTATLLLAGALLGIVNAFVRPIAVLLTLPITLLTLGIFLLVVNAGMLALVAWIVPGFGIAGFWSAVLCAVVVGITGWIGSWFIGSRGVERIKRR